MDKQTHSLLQGSLNIIKCIYAIVPWLIKHTVGTKSMQKQTPISLTNNTGSNLG